MITILTAANSAPEYNKLEIATTLKNEPVCTRDFSTGRTLKRLTSRDL
jgi:hypothetical protein